MFPEVERKPDELVGSILLKHKQRSIVTGFITTQQFLVLHQRRSVLTDWETWTYKVAVPVTSPQLLCGTTFSLKKKYRDVSELRWISRWLASDSAGGTSSFLAAAFFSQLQTLIWYYFKTELNGVCLLLDYECVVGFSKHPFGILCC